MPLRHLPYDTAAPAHSAAAAALQPWSVERIVELMPGFIYVYNHRTQANEYTNRSVGQYLGYDPDELRAMGDALFLQITHPQDLPKLIAHVGAMQDLDADGTLWLDYRIRAKDGRTVWLRSVDRIFERGTDGHVLRHIGCATDITAEKQSSLDLASAHAQLTEQAEELRQLTFVATHDLKVPVNNLARLSLMLQDCADDLSPDVRELVDWLNRAAEQANEKIASLVHVSQIRDEPVAPDPLIDPRGAIAAALWGMRARLRAAGARLVLQVERGLRVRFHPDDLRAVLHSLLQNACDYADATRPLTITIRAHATANGLAIAVQDTGTGIDLPRDEENLFGLFKRLHVDPPGQGVALYCARTLVQRRGGTLQAQGAPGQGATFTLTIPRARTQP
ncbi:PAS domain-containing sensor histidine kinase [Sulfitobacter sp. S190]|uniref:sensor histidine kinase n=1 Tax=Sulfitobacter sp. S190 TaxID=2867022 RepID=UPI0021A8D6B2|nr:PAS domain-containing sensor histidine kinase [Sulfitobacter sp. S190]UWR21378.1 PAS domain-containing sensor histidine kinase [Sulfitobacter sp. S190]